MIDIFVDPGTFQSTHQICLQFMSSLAYNQG